MKRIISLVTNDLEGDQRVHKTALSLLKSGFEPVLLGRLLPDSHELARSYPCHRFRLLWKSGPMFYLNINLRFFFYLLFRSYSHILANDLDTLLAAYLASRIRRKTLIFDSHEYFTEVPELVNRPRIQKIWKGLERFLLKRVKSMMTVNQEIAHLFEQEYQLVPEVIMNLPLQVISPSLKPKTLDAEAQEIVVLYQGAVNAGRGLHELIMAFEYLPKHRLNIIGGGDLLETLRLAVAQLPWSHQILFKGRLPLEELPPFALEADLGVSLEQDFGLNYRLALPNKLFDYMHAGLPVVVSNLPVMKSLVESVDFGIITDQFHPQYLANQILELTADPERYTRWSTNALLSAPKYSWEAQESKLLRLIQEAS